MEFRILGPLEVCSEGRQLSLGGAKQRAVLAVLLLRRNEVVSTDRLIDELWGDRPPATAAKTVQVYVSQLRKALRDRTGRDEAASVLVTKAPGYVLVVKPGELDADRFAQLVDEGTQALAAGTPRIAARVLLEGLALWRGPALADFALDSFAQTEAARLEEARISALEERIEADLALGRHVQLVGELESLVAAHPLRERLCGQLMLALYRSGRQAEALNAYRDARRTLVEQLGLEPGPALQQLERAILAHDAALAPPPPVDAEPDAAHDMDGVGEQPPRIASRSRWKPVAAAGAALVVASGIATGAVLATDRGPASPRSVAINSLARIDANTGRLTGSIPVGVRPVAVAVGQGSLWVTNFDEQTVSRIDPATGKELTRVPAGGAPTGIAVGAGSVWVTHGFAGTVSQIDPGVNRITATAQVGSSVGDVALAGNSVWVLQENTGTVLRLDPTTGEVMRTIVVGGNPTSLAADAHDLWIADGRTVVKVDAATNRIAARIALRHLATNVAVGGGSVWVSANLANIVTRIDPTTGSTEVEIPVPEGPDALAADANAVWVADSLSGSVSRIDPATNRVADTIPVGRQPGGVALSDGALWVTVAAP
jgi:YVTN family beta-propeller protein